MLFPDIAPWIRLTLAKLFYRAFKFRKWQAEVPMSWMRWEIPWFQVPLMPRLDFDFTEIESCVLKDMKDEWGKIIPTGLLGDNDFIKNYEVDPVFIIEGEPVKLYTVNLCKGPAVAAWAQELMKKKNSERLKAYLDEHEPPERAGEISRQPSPLTSF